MRSSGPTWPKAGSEGAATDIVLALIGALILAQFIDGRVAFALGILAVIAFRLWRWRGARRTIHKLGLTPDQASAVHADLQRGDRDAAIRRIEAAQEVQRDRIKAAAGVDPREIIPEVGRDISWSDIVRHAFRVTDFDRAGTTVGADGQVRTISSVMPYGYLIVESPILNQQVRLPIIHRDDFLLASSVFDDPGVADAVTQEELLVTYAPKRKLPDGRSASASHVLHYAITPRGTLDRYYALDNDAHMSKPAPEKLFGPFVFDGRITVHVNREPML